MQEEPSAQQPDELLRNAYPDERERARAERQLGWLARHMNNGEPLTVVDDTKQGSPEARPARSPIGRVGHPRRGNRSGGGRHILALGGRVLGHRRHRIVAANARRGAGRVRERHPCAFVRRWPRWSDLALVLVVAVTTLGLGFLPALVSIWCVRADQPPEASATRIYRADRLTSFGLRTCFHANRCANGHPRALTCLRVGPLAGPARC